MSSLKRKSIDAAPDSPGKKLRASPPPDSTLSNNAANGTTAAPDSYIDPTLALAYWSATAPTVSGVLGGYPQVSRADLQGSRNFLAKLIRARRGGNSSEKLRRVVDCGAGIGRVTKGLLTGVAQTTDIVEPVVRFTAEIAGQPGVGKVYNVGLAEWEPEVAQGGKYDLVWNQWCVGQLTDAQLVQYLRRLPEVLSEGGWIVVKENLSNQDEDVYDETDSSVTRTDVKFRSLFAQARLKIIATELQRGMPKGLYPVRAYALQPT